MNISHFLFLEIINALFLYGDFLLDFFMSSYNDKGGDSISPLI